MCYLVCGMVHIKEPLLLNGKSSPCGGSGFPLSLSEWSFTICDRRALQQLVLNVHVKHTDLTCEFLKSHMRSDEDRSQTDSRSCKYFTTGSFPHLSLIYKMNRQCYFTREHVSVEPGLEPVPPAPPPPPPLPPPPASVCIIKVSQKWNNWKHNASFKRLVTPYCQRPTISSRWARENKHGFVGRLCYCVRS